MRPIREITAEEERFRTEPVAPGLSVIRRDYVEPEPVGTILLMPMKVTGYDRDCDGAALAQLSALSTDAEETGVGLGGIGLYPNSGLVVTETELQTLPSMLQSLRQDVLQLQSRYKGSATEPTGAWFALNDVLDLIDNLRG